MKFGKSEERSLKRLDFRKTGFSLAPVMHCPRLALRKQLLDGELQMETHMARSWGRPLPTSQQGKGTEAVRQTAHPAWTLPPQPDE